ncbi:hypothetical protein J5N97_003194 [Dioscorea zingiberensis]|uniref:DRBM domain-containing protein n=1 Tax=Dioscorea zingiberensis TaxID=325984 RepID=A0A9D5D489_9LILI|nr:hypothetical protein J5N97_003194 [Dioscorea zingiberensis]
MEEGSLMLDILPAKRKQGAWMEVFGDEDDKNFTRAPSRLPSLGAVIEADSQKVLVGNGMARLKLSEICAARHWKPPLFVLCEEPTRRQSEMFIYKVIIEVDTISSTLLECFSEPKTLKEAAQEHAAEGALWYFQQLGYLRVRKSNM